VTNKVDVAASSGNKNLAIAIRKQIARKLSTQYVQGIGLVTP